MRAILQQAVSQSLRRETYLMERRIQDEVQEAEDQEGELDNAEDKEDQPDKADSGQKG